MCGALGNEVRIKPAGERRTPPPPSSSFSHLSAPLPPSNSLSMPSRDEGAVRASLLDLTHQGETLTATQGATQQTGKALPTKCDVWKLKLLWRCANESHLHMLHHTLTNTHAQS